MKEQNVSHPLFDNNDETRLPGTALIGHANAWLLKLSSSNGNNEYERLFCTLRRYNLTQNKFSEANIIHLISTPDAARRNLESIQLLSNDQWVEQNKPKVDAFRQRRWPSYPFETKFEIMKLISKHIITVNDLIVDEKAESILQQCSINTLVACTVGNCGVDFFYSDSDSDSDFFLLFNSDSDFDSEKFFFLIPIPTPTPRKNSSSFRLRLRKIPKFFFVV